MTAEASFEVASNVPLKGELELGAVAERIPRAHQLKGMFFLRCVNLVAADWDRLAATLDEPPVNGRYHAFTSYPVRDYLRLFVAAARKKHPQVPSREALRLFARDEVRSFESTMLGRVTFSMLHDPTAALLRYPEVFTLLAHGPTASATKLADRAVLVELRNAHAPVEYALGVLEGLVLAFGRHSRTAVTATSGVARFEVRWTV